MVAKTLELSNSPNKQTWKELATVTLARLLCFNKRRANEAASMSVEKFTNRADWKKGNKELMKSLKPLERQLMKR